MPAGGPGSGVILEERRWIIRDMLLPFIHECINPCRTLGAELPIGIFTCMASPTLPNRRCRYINDWSRYFQGQRYQVVDVVLNLPE